MRKHTLLSAVMPGLSKPKEEKKPTQTLNVDYPQAGEKVQLGHYAIRVSGCESECQVSVDDGPFAVCRQDAGFCWLDWNVDKEGAHRIVARTRVNNKWAKAERTCRTA